MSNDEETRLRDLVAQILTVSGVLPKLKAEVRASVFHTLENSPDVSELLTINKELTALSETEKGSIILNLIREFMIFFKLKFVLSVFEPESGYGTSYLALNRENLIKKLKIVGNKKRPLLFDVLNLDGPSNDMDLNVNAYNGLNLAGNGLYSSSTSLGQKEKVVPNTSSQGTSDLPSETIGKEPSPGNLEVAVLSSPPDNKQSEDTSRQCLTPVTKAKAIPAKRLHMETRLSRRAVASDSSTGKMLTRSGFKRSPSDQRADRGIKLVPEAKNSQKSPAEKHLRTDPLLIKRDGSKPGVGSPIIQDKRKRKRKKVISEDLTGVTLDDKQRCRSSYLPSEKQPSAANVEDVVLSPQKEYLSLLSLTPVKRVEATPEKLRRRETRSSWRAFASGSSTPTGKRVTWSDLQQLSPSNERAGSENNIVPDMNNSQKFVKSDEKQLRTDSRLVKRDSRKAGAGCSIAQNEEHVGIKEIIPEELVGVKLNIPMDTTDDNAANVDKGKSGGVQGSSTKKKKRRQRHKTTYECSQCEYITNRRSSMIRHTRGKHGTKKDKIQKCPECAFRCVERGNLSMHMRGKHGTAEDKRHKCHLCDYRTVRRSDLITHICGRHGTAEDKRYKCQFCNYAGAACCHLVIHTRRKHGTAEDKRYKCQFCAYASVTSFQLRRHSRIHRRPI